MADLVSLGRYQLRRVLGRGAMGVVYEGLDPTLDRRVAVKTILKSVGLDEETERAYSERFVREAKAVARLNHPNIVQVYDFGQENEVAYLVMEFIQGKELRSFISATERVTTQECVRIMGELLDALDFAHERGVIHRDIKPANVILDEQRRVKLADFGVARVQDSDRSAAGTMVGTPAFMSPEQIQGLKIDRRTDIFSAGVVFYQLLTGEAPFKGEGAWTVAKKIMQDEPPPPSSIVSNVSPTFDGIVERALAKNPAERFATAREFADALRGALVSAPAARPAPKHKAPAPAQVTSPRPAPDDATVAIPERPRAAASPPEEKKRSSAVPAILAAAVIAGGIGAYLFLGRATAPAPVSNSAPAPQAEKPVPAKPEVTAADLEKIRKETEERIRREYSDKSAAEQAAAAKAATEKAVQEKAVAAKAEKAAAEKTIAAKAAAERAALEQAAAEKASAEKAAAAKASADKAAAERLAAEKAQAEKVAAERASQEKAAAEKARLLAAAGIEQFKARHPDKVWDHEPETGTINFREIVYVNDKSCPPGKIRELTGGSPTRGVERKNRCISLSE
ncbi:MAG TPA: DUF6719 family protein [Burkholderiales bacterium]